MGTKPGDDRRGISHFARRGVDARDCYTGGLIAPDVVPSGYRGDGNATAFQTRAFHEGLRRTGASSDTPMAPAMTGERQVR